MTDLFGDLAAAGDPRALPIGPWVRRALTVVMAGEPIVLVADGRILDRYLRRQRMTVDEVKAEARLAQIGSLGDVRFAVLETSGKISLVTHS